MDIAIWFHVGMYVMYCHINLLVKETLGLVLKKHVSVVSNFMHIDKLTDFVACFGVDLLS
jgi:hypothetical protein